jgi:formylglycine-generating enzyme required for sulfatase activity
MNKMRKVFLLVLLSFIVYSCTKTRDYEVVGAQGRKPFYPEVPTGMVYVPAGGFTMGLHDQDILNLDDARAKVVTISAFYMDQTEISNNEYRQFVEWVRDSIGLEHLVDRGLREQLVDYINFDQDILFSIQGTGADIKIANFYYDNKPLNFSKVKIDGTSDDPILGEEVVPFEIDQMEKDGREIYNTLFADGFDADKADAKTIQGGDGQKQTENLDLTARNIKNNWLSLNWESQASYRMWDDPKLMPLLADMFYSSKERYYKRREIDIRNLVYEYYWIDYKEAANKGEIAYYDSPKSYDFSEKPQDASKRLDARDGALLYRKVQDENNPTFYPGSTGQPISGVKSDGSFQQQNSFDVNRATDPMAKDSIEIGGSGDEKNRDGFISGKDLDMGYMNRKMEWNAYRGHTDRSRFIIHEKIPVYPDTLCWVNDLTYSNGKEMANYFWHPAYDNYPVVGVTWKQAKAFSVWRTQLLNNFLVANGDIYLNDFRLPTEAEWERAARGDLALQSYPWGGPYIRNASGCFLGNFKPMRGRYFEDGGVYTVKVYSYNPNNYGLYCMAGNVSEWCESAYDETSYEFMDDINPEFSYDAKKWEPEVMKRKVIRGGSWKDVGHYLNVGTRSYEYQDTAKSYVGFRNVMTHLGRGGKDITKEGGEEIQSDINLR